MQGALSTIPPPVRTFTVGAGISPAQAIRHSRLASRAVTAGRELHPTPEEQWYMNAKMYTIKHRQSTCVHITEQTSACQSVAFHASFSEYRMAESD